MAFRPLGDRVLVKRVEEEQKTKGGIIIPDTAKDTSNVTEPSQQQLFLKSHSLMTIFPVS